MLFRSTASRAWEGLTIPQLPDEIASVEALGRVFAAIDPLRDVLSELSWQPPQIVVMGNENSGKSTLLERIAMMPLFPTDKKICTRMVVKIQLRRGEPRAPILQVSNIADRAVIRRMEIPMDRAAARIEEVMNEEVRKENGGSLVGVCLERVLTIQVQSTTVRN